MIATAAIGRLGDRVICCPPFSDTHIVFFPEGEIAFGNQAWLAVFF